MNSNSFCDETDNTCSCLEGYFELEKICAKIDLNKNEGNGFCIYGIIDTLILMVIIASIIIYKKYAGRRITTQGLYPFENLENYSAPGSLVHAYATVPV